jgi:integral membrane protein (TIGR03766 family)
MEYVSKLVKNLIVALFLIFAFLWIVNVLQNAVLLPQNLTFFWTKVLFSGMLVTVLVLIFPLGKKLFYQIGNFLQRYKWVFFSIAVVLQAVLVIYGTTEYWADVYALFHSATGSAKDINSLYFSRYPNNLFLFYIYKFFTWPISGFYKYLILNLVNALAVDLAFILFYRVMKSFLDNLVATFGFYFFLLVLGLSPYILMPYSDTFSLPFSVLMMSFGLRILQERRVSTGDWILFLFSGVIAFLLKPSTIIPVIALILVYALFIKEKGHLKTIGILFALLVGMFGIVKSSMFVLENYGPVHIQQGRSIPMTHFVMMGLNKGEQPGSYLGGWNLADFENTVSNESTDAMSNYNKKVIVDRLKNFGVLGYAKFLLEKERATTQDGDFTANPELMIAKSEINPTSKTKVSGWIADHLYPRGVSFNTYRIYAQILFVLLSLGVLFAAVFTRATDVAVTFFKLSVLGGILFLLIFEGGRGRYLIQFMPYFVILSSIGWEKFFSVARRLSADRNVNNRG